MVVSELASKPASTADMSLDEAERVFSAILDGDMPLDEAGDLLVALSRRGESEDEILGCVRAMMRRVEPSDFGPLDPRVREIQEAYIRQVVDTVHDLPNVLYEVANVSSGV